MLERARSHPITRSVVRRGSGMANRVLDHAFALAFRGLVYAQIWEDPDVDMTALQIRPDSRIIAIASGGCNVLSYLTADPEAITAVDLNTAHIALNKLKLAAAQHLPDHAHFRRVSSPASTRSIFPRSLPRATLPSSAECSSAKRLRCSTNASCAG